MYRMLSGILIVLLVSAGLLAQTKASKPSKGPTGLINVAPGTISGTHLPVRVKGEGIITSSGVRYWDVEIGSGSPALRGHTVTVLYRAWAREGKEFAGSDLDGKPVVFTLGAGQVIPGWEDGIEGMKAGGKRQLRIPPNLAYGERGIPPLVPANATLIFDIELVAVQ